MGAASAAPEFRCGWIRGPAGGVKRFIAASGAGLAARFVARKGRSQRRAFDLAQGRDLPRADMPLILRGVNAALQALAAGTRTGSRATRGSQEC